ncbi:MAG: FAD-binding protein [Deltaproteobacteria bacterium]|nr:FAD-binding protein [Deltaproteobacteria bacterium]
MEEKAKKGLINIVGEENFTDAVIDLVSYSYDASPEHHRPDGAVWVKNRDQISAILKLANEYMIPVIPRGAGTGLSGMAVPKQGGIVLDMAHMNKILEISIKDRLAVVQPGVVYQDLQNDLAPHGFFFPPDPASGSISTLGGNVATNAGGLKGAKYGTTRDYVLGLEVVLADGSVLRTGSRCMKCVSGYDLTRLFVGSEGTLGVITEIILKINPRPRAEATCLAAFDDISHAGNAITEIMCSGIIPSVLEILDDQCILAINKATDLHLPEVAALVLVETDGYSQEETDLAMDIVVEVFRQNNAKEITRAASAEEAEKLWTARKSLGGVMTLLNNTFIAEDITVPISKVPDVLIGVKEISKRYNLLIPTAGHLGDGNLHPCIVYDGTNPDEAARVKQASADLFRLGIDLGGTLTGEHGIGLEKAEFMPMEHNAVAMGVMNNLKKLFDPNSILNPGKMGLEV